jgi:hypothetical protein
MIVAEFDTGVRAADVLARVTDSNTSTNASSHTDVHGRGHVLLRVDPDPAGRPVQVDLSVAGGAKTCSTVFEVGRR